MLMLFKGPIWGIMDRVTHSLILAGPQSTSLNPENLNLTFVKTNGTEIPFLFLE
jgi:hypothetical protein